MKKKTIQKRKVKADAIGLDYTLAKFAVPRLKWIEDHAMSHPTDLTMDEWKAILRKIRAGFETAIDYNESLTFKMTIEERREITREAFTLMGEYYMDLWD